MESSQNIKKAKIMVDTSNPIQADGLVRLIPLVAAAQLVGIDHKIAEYWLKSNKIQRKRIKGAYYVKSEDIFRFYKIQGTKGKLNYEDAVNALIEHSNCPDTIEEELLEQSKNVKIYG